MTVREFFDRYGPTVAVLAVLALLAVLVPGNAPKKAKLTTTAGSSAAATTDNASASGATDNADTSSATDAASGATTGGASATRTGGSTAAAPTGGTKTAGPAGATTGGAAPAAGGGAAASKTTGLQFGTGPDCRPDGREKQMSTYSPPCVLWEQGRDNGGPTAPGVTANKILITRFVSQSDPATDAALQAAGATDSEADQQRIYNYLRIYYNNHSQTYGREVVFKNVPASGKDSDEAAMKSDALKIATEYHAFANFGGPNILASELAQRGVVCACTTSATEGFYAANPPYIFASLPTLEDYYQHYAEYVCKRLAGRKAKWAGDPAMQAQDRKFGLIYYEGALGRADPDYKKARDYYVGLLSKCGVTLAAEASYIYELENAGGQSEEFITKMKSANVSNLLFVGDPLYPVVVTKQATKQGYFPEWFISGTVLIDTTFFGRTYDQAQWAHAFGISPLWVFSVDVAASSGYRAYHHAKPGAPRGEEGVGINVYQAPVQLLFNGINMAGPNLTADSFSQGLYNYPKSGGKAAAPLVYFTKRSPNAIKDFTEVYWDSTGHGLDETGHDGAGRLLKAEKGKRYAAGGWPDTDPKVFSDSGGQEVFTDDNPPGGPATVAHEEDGHTHDYAHKACLSCDFAPSA